MNDAPSYSPDTAAGDVGARRTYRGEEVAALLGISRSTAQPCVRSGEIPSLRLRRRMVIPAAAVQRLLADPAR